MAPATADVGDLEVIVPDVGSSVRWWTHGYPDPLARWHHHPEIEFHLIRSGSGQMLAGDRAIDFAAGQVTLMGPRSGSWYPGRGGASSCSARAADLVALSPSAFSRFFDTTAGLTFSGLVRRRRIARACHLLRTTDLPVARVCVLSGYTSLANFDRRFRDETGTASSAYRRGGG
ncbi:AraC-like ligand binding domain-containing protein [Actinomyces ruminicola]|uniref:AraC-like ligand binding domain-containing protein n=2 Tax=Actinomyces ruminicola TaxID=332524 RepID=A0A1G9Y6F2_9ACTO|nr:AraC-like ligand binding domain-containing protein [Actinomyces ruminicola]